MGARISRMDLIALCLGRDFSSTIELLQWVVIVSRELRWSVHKVDITSLIFRQQFA